MESLIKQEMDGKGQFVVTAKRLLRKAILRIEIL